MQKAPAAVPMMLFDGECGFCRHWIKKWDAITAGRVRYAPYQEKLSAYPQLTETQCVEAVQLILPGGAVLSGAKAVFKALSLGGRYGALLALYEKAPLFGRLAEFFYQVVAHHRIFFSRLSR